MDELDCMLALKLKNKYLVGKINFHFWLIVNLNVVNETYMIYTCTYIDNCVHILCVYVCVFFINEDMLIVHIIHIMVLNVCVVTI